MANINLASLTFPGLSDTYVIPSEIAKLGTTLSSNADIEAALTDGKVPRLMVNNGLDPSDYCWYVGKTSSTKHYFAGVVMDGKTLVAICDNGTWSFSRTAIPVAATGQPQPLGTPSAGVYTEFSRGDHVHAMPSAADVGAIAAPSSPATGAFLVWNGSAWVAQTLSTWQGGNY